MSILTSTTRRAMLLAASVLSLGVTAASAQDYYYYNRAAYDRYGPTEEVIVQAPYYYRHQRDSATGAPIVDVAMQREVRYDDLDLRTGWGVRALRTRISATARALCNRLDVRYPATTSDSPPCYRSAYYDAMAQADNAIARARGGY